MKTLQVLGTGCARCKALQAAAEAAAQQAGIEYTIEKITDINQMMQFGIMATPALAIDGKVVVQGGIPSAAKLREMIEA